MKRLVLFILSVMILSSCARKVYILDANKIDYLDEIHEAETEIDFTSYYAGDAIDYLIFEMDLKNDSDRNIELSYKDIELRISNKKSDEIIILEPLNKEDVIESLMDIYSQRRAEKRSRDIGNAIDLGFNLLFIGTNGYGAIDAIFYSVDVATIMMEDARAHKLLTGTIEEQKQYINDWVLGSDRLNPGEEKSWDILFPRKLIEGPATFTLNLDKDHFTQEYRLFIVEKKVPR